MEFQINENVEIDLAVEICHENQLDEQENTGRIRFAALSGNDWASYSLTSDGILIAEQVCFEALEVHKTGLLVDWYKATYPDEYANATLDDVEIAEIAEEKLDDVLDSPDMLYNEKVADTWRIALADWIAQESPKIYRDDIRSFGNEFHLTFVLEGGEYQVGKDEYEIEAEDAARMFFMYTNDDATEDHSSHSVVE